jgi:hypothetical protein
MRCADAAGDGTGHPNVRPCSTSHGAGYFGGNSIHR